MVPLWLEFFLSVHSIGGDVILCTQHSQHERVPLSIFYYHERQISGRISPHLVLQPASTGRYRSLLRRLPAWSYWGESTVWPLPPSPVDSDINIVAAHEVRFTPAPPVMVQLFTKLKTPLALFLELEHNIPSPLWTFCKVQKQNVARGFSHAWWSSLYF